MKDTELKNKIEAVLFYTSEPIELSFLVKILEVEKEEVLESLRELSQTLKERGIRLLENGTEYSLVTAPEHSVLIEKITKEEREKDLGRASIEVLSLIAYKGPVSKKEIEYIRGVNSQYALRNLLLRGLVERKQSQSDERMVVYTITGETLRFLGLTSLEELPEYKEFKTQLEIQETDKKEEETENGE
ncbi:MAG TPA: SMC-Scp complex subunit ScpB [Candidatus Paceibacterota bacterium]